MYRRKTIVIKFVLLFVIIYSGTIFSQGNWIKYPVPVLETGSTGSWDENIAGVNTVLLEDNLYKMWYEGDGGIGYATSSDGIHWIKDLLNNPVLIPGSSGAWDESEINHASVLHLNNTYHLWYSGIDAAHDNRIGHAISLDGINWTKDSSNPVIDLGPSGRWDDHEVIHPTVIMENDTLKMWYNGHDGITQRVLFAFSLDGSNWTRYTVNPVMEHGPSGSWDEDEIGPLSILHLSGTYHMWYTGWNYNMDFRIGYATSSDGYNWNKDASNPVIQPGDVGSWESEAVGVPFVIIENDTLKMWYGGTDNIKFQTGYATLYFPTTGVNVFQFPSLNDFSLSQNYPNPFNPGTKISWQSPVGSWQILNVYDVLGNEVAKLVDEEKPAGSYTVEFNASNLASGIYFYQLKAGEYVGIKKMILIK